MKKYIGCKRFWYKKMVGPKDFYIKIFCVQKNVLGLKNLVSKNLVMVHNNIGSKNTGLKKLDQNFIKRIFLSYNSY